MMVEKLQGSLLEQPDIAPRFHVKAERNTKGWNIEASVSNDTDAEHALMKLSSMTMALEQTYPRELTQKAEKQ